MRSEGSNKTRQEGKKDEMEVRTQRERKGERGTQAGEDERRNMETRGEDS